MGIQESPLTTWAYELELCCLSFFFGLNQRDERVYWLAPQPGARQRWWYSVKCITQYTSELADFCFNQQPLQRGGVIPDRISLSRNGCGSQRHFFLTAALLATAEETRAILGSVV